MLTAALAEAAAGVAAAGWAADGLVLRSRLRAARRDPLTGLATRGPWTARARRIHNRPGALVLLADVDDFKAVNDRWGHLAGDAVLAAVGQRLALWAGRRGATGRLGGDEFAAACPIAPADAAAALEQLAARLAEPVPAAPGVPIPVSVSVGAALAPGRDLPASLAAADAAMYRAKRAGLRWQLAGPQQQLAPCRAPTRRARHHGPEGGT